jgi:hypothetical protein
MRAKGPDKILCFRYPAATARRSAHVMRCAFLPARTITGTLAIPAVPETAVRQVNGRPAAS